MVLSFLSPRVDEDEEIIVKAMTDYWVVGKKSDQRELYVILNQKNANLIEVNGMFPPSGGPFGSCLPEYTVIISTSPIPLFSFFFPLQKKLRGFVRHSLTTYSSWTERTDGDCSHKKKLSTSQDFSGSISIMQLLHCIINNNIEKLSHQVIFC